MQHTEQLYRYFNLIRSHQQFIPWSPRLEIKPVTTECRPKTLPQSYWSTSQTWQLPCQLTWCIFVSYICTLTRDMVTSKSPPGLRIPKKIRGTHQCNYNLLGKDIDVHFALQYTLLMRPNKVETAVQRFRMSHRAFAGFSVCGNSIYNIIPLL